MLPELISPDAAIFQSAGVTVIGQVQ